MTRAHIVSAAREYLGTPYIHQGRLKGAGVDCLGIIEGVGTAFGLPFVDLSCYDHGGGGAVTITDEFKKWLDVVAPLSAKPGDVLTFWVRQRGFAQHCAIKTENGMIHTHGGTGSVVEHALDTFWQKRLIGAFSFRGIEE